MGSYIGKRVVPKHCGYWDSGRSYEMLSVVYENTSGNSYISRKEVPAGTDISQEEYWALCSDFNMQMDLMGKHFTETEQRIKADNDATEAAIKADNDSTESAIKADNDETEKVILADNAQTREYVDTSLAETTKTLTETVTSARDDMTEQKESFDATAKQLNTRMDSVLAAGTGAGDTEILDARVDVEGNTHETMGVHIRAVGQEVVDARAGLGGEVYQDLKTAMESFSDPFLVGHRLVVRNSVVVLANKNDYTAGTVENLTDRAGLVRAGKFRAVILQEYDQSSIMTHTAITVEDFKTYLLGKSVFVELYSPIAGVMNFSIGSQSSDGRGAIDDPNGSPVKADGTIGLNSISYNFRVAEGYNELELNLSEDLPQVQKLAELIDAGEFTRININTIPFQWSNVTFLPETGKTYEFIIAIRDNSGHTRGSVESYFQMPSPASAATAQHALTSDTAEIAYRAENAEYTEQAGAAAYAIHAGVSSVGDDAYVTNAAISIDIEEGSREVSVTFGSDCPVAAGTGFSVRIGKVRDFLGKQLFFQVRETEGFAFTYTAINFGAFFGNKSYVQPAEGIKKITDTLYALDFDTFAAKADAGGISYNADTDCWLMRYGNSPWDLSGLSEGDTVTNTYGVYLEEVGAIIYSRMLEERNTELENEMAVMSERMTAQDTQIAEQAEQITALTEALGKVQESNVLWGKKWFATGDSFTSGGSMEDDKYFTDGPYEGKIKTYPLFIARRNNMDCINDAISGSIMALSKNHLADPENVDINTKRPFSYQRYLSIPEDVDYITLWFGINDASNTNLGTIDDTTNETFYGAWNVVMEWILTNRPWAHVGIIITNGSSKAYREAEREIAKKWGIPYLDMMGDDQVPVMTLGREDGLCTTAYNLRRSTFSVGHTPNGDSHPCWQAHEYESTFIEAFLRRL